MAYLRTAQTNKSVTCIYVPNCLYFVLRTGLAGRSVQSYEKGSFFSAFSHFGSFSQVFSQVKECLISQMHEMIKVLLAVAFPIVFILFYDQYSQGGVLKLKKNYHFF